MKPQRTPVELFDSSCPPQFLEDTLRMLFGVYAVADDECRVMPREVAHDFQGQRRRALIEERWPPIAQKFQDNGVLVSYQANCAKSSFFARITCGNVVLTQSFVDTPETIVRRAEFRNTLARSNQPDLFMDDPPPLPSDPLFGLLIHGEAAKRHHPCFAHVVFPDPECKTYLGRIDLFARYPALIALLTQPIVQEEIIKDEATPKLRSQKKRDA